MPRLKIGFVLTDEEKVKLGNLYRAAGHVKKLLDDLDGLAGLFARKPPQRPPPKSGARKP